MTEPVPRCITCSDEGLEMRVLELDDTAGLALCARDDGQRATVETGLLGAVGVGDLVLVHADVALTTLERAR